VLHLSRKRRCINIKIRLLSLLLIPGLLLSSCARPGPDKPSADTRLVVDQAGREVEITYPVERIVSGYYISSSACIALGLAGRMVGIEARAAARPIYALAAPELLQLPDVGTAKEFSLETCLALEPDLVLLPVHLRDKAEIMEELGVPVVLVNPESFDGLLGMISLIGEAAGITERAERMLGYYGDLRAAVGGLTDGLAERPVVYMGGVASYLTTAPGDMYQSSLIALAGGDNAAKNITGSGWTQISYEQLLVMDPDVIVIPAEAGYDCEDIFADARLISLAAVRDGRVYRMPGEFEAWDSPVPSAMLGVLWMLSLLHGDLFSIAELRDAASAFYGEFYGILIDADLIGK